jgi:hypothetical protein
VKIKGDNVLHAVEFGRATPRPDSHRWYYQVVGYDDLVLVCHDYPYPEWHGRPGMVLVDPETVDGRLICERFPKAPNRWDGRSDLVQITVRPDYQRTRGQGMLLSEAIIHFVGPPSAGVVDKG